MDPHLPLTSSAFAADVDVEKKMTVFRNNPNMKPPLPRKEQKSYGKRDITAALSLNVLFKTTNVAACPEKQVLGDAKEKNIETQNGVMVLQNMPGIGYMNLLYSIYGRLKYILTRESSIFFPLTFPCESGISYPKETFPFVNFAENRADILFSYHILDWDHGKNVRLVLEYLNDLLECFPSDPLILSLRGEAYRQLKQNELALKDFQTTLKRNPDHIIALCGMGALLFESAMSSDCFSKQAELVNAVKTLDRALTVAPNSLFALVLRAKAHFFLGEIPQSCLDIQTAKKISPFDPLVLVTFNTIYQIDDENFGEVSFCTE